MATYIVSDIHGRYIHLRRALAMVMFTEEDTLIINGDLIDRGSESAQCIEYVLDKPNVELIIGNHEVLYQQAYKYNKGYLYGEGIDSNEAYLHELNGGDRTVKSLANYMKIYNRDLVSEFYEHLKICKYYKTIDNLIISHTGIEDKSVLNNLTEFVWQRDFFEKYFCKEGSAITESQIIGHTSVGRNYICMEPGNTEFSFIKRNKNKFILNLDASDKQKFIPIYRIEDNTLHLCKWGQHMVLDLENMEVNLKK